jgi:hypothetical protein
VINTRTSDNIIINESLISMINSFIQHFTLFHRTTIILGHTIILAKTCSIWPKPLKLHFLRLFILPPRSNLKPWDSRAGAFARAATQSRKETKDMRRRRTAHTRLLNMVRWYLAIIHISCSINDITASPSLLLDII